MLHHQMLISCLSFASLFQNSNKIMLLHHFCMGHEVFWVVCSSASELNHTRGSHKGRVQKKKKFKM